MNVEIIAATRPEIRTRTKDTYGLCTMRVHVPLFIWTEILTHRRFARNASSARAMSTERYTSMGYYKPTTWYKQQSGMQAGAAIDDDHVMEDARTIYNTAFQKAVEYAQELESKGIAKEQRNRLIPPIKYVTGIITGTESAWRAFLALRNNTSADTAMQDIAEKIAHALANVSWNYGIAHLPYVQETDSTAVDDKLRAIAHIARVSYNRDSGLDDLSLARRLLRDGHLSPFEHIAYWTRGPHLNCYVCKDDDVIGKYPSCYGWQSWRADMETGLYTG